MAEILKIFQNLSQYYSPHLNVNIVEDLFEKAKEKKLRKQKESEDKTVDPKSTNQAEQRSNTDEQSSSGTDSENDSSADEGNSVLNFKRIADIPIVKSAVEDSQVLSCLLSLCSAIRELRESHTGSGPYSNTYDCWDIVIVISPKEKFLTFIYTLLNLAPYDPSSKIYRKLTIMTARAYILSLTIPGSKGFHIFDEQIIGCALESFHLIDSLQDTKIGQSMTQEDRMEMWVLFSNLCDDFKIMFRYIHFDECLDIRNSIIWELNKLLYNNLVNGFENRYAAFIHANCFEILDEITNPHNGEPKDTFMKIMRISYCQHALPPSSKNREGFNRAGNSGSATQFCEHISDWFIKSIEKYPRIVTIILKKYIECVIIKPEKDWRNEQMQRALDYAAKYDAALYTKCNESSVEFLLEATQAADAQIRSHAVEMLNRLLLNESKPNWEVFTHEVSKTPREIPILKELVERLLDVNNSVKLKALNGLQQAFVKGTETTLLILTEGMKYAVFNDENVNLPVEPRLGLKEIRYQRPSTVENAKYTVEGFELVKPCFVKLPNILYFLMRNQMAHIRRAAIMMLENAVKLNPLVIYNTRFVQECSKLGDDPSQMVRKQALIMIDSVIDHYPNCYPSVYAWTQVVVALFKDSDNKIVDQTWESFKKRVFDNMRGIDKSNKAEHFMPWIILRVLLSTQQRLFLQSCVQGAISKQIINQTLFDLIQSHTITSNSTIAWILLSFIGGKIKSKDPDALISTFIKTVLDQSYNAAQNLQIMLEVLVIWIADFSHAALNRAFAFIVNLLKTGAIPPNMVSKALTFCQTIDRTSENKRNESQTNKNQPKCNERVNAVWIQEVHKSAEEYLLQNMAYLRSNRIAVMSFLFIYLETNIELDCRPHQTITQFVQRYLKHKVDSVDSDTAPEDVCTLNEMIILASICSLRDASIAGETCLTFRLMLRKTNRSTTVNNLIVCLTDLCKRHADIVELAMGEIVLKLRSPLLEQRLVTFNNLAQLVLQDVIKLRGNLLLSLMTILLDENIALSNRATEFFTTYLEKKNAHLFHSCLIECPFVYNMYHNFDGFESFALTELNVVSPLKGDENMESRRRLYYVFMLRHEETELMMYFENLKLIYSLVLKDPLVQCDNGYSAIKDILHIMKEICFLHMDKNDGKTTGETATGTQDADEEESPSLPQPADDESQTVARTNSKRKHSVPIMKDAITCVEKMIGLVQKIAEVIIPWNSSFQEPIDDLCVGLCLRFNSLTEFLQPKHFWLKYRKIAKQDGETIKKKYSENAKRREDQEADENSGQGDINRLHEVERGIEESPISLLFRPFLL